MSVLNSLFVWFFKNIPTKEDAMSSLLSAYRIFAGLAMLPYGWGKIRKYESLSENFFNNPVWIGHEISLILCVFQQIFCACLLVLGIQSRFAAFMLFTNMLVAAKVHYFDPFVPTSSLPIVYMAMYAFLTLSGGGKFSIDSLVFKNQAFNASSYSNLSYSLRAAMIFGASAFSWFVVAKSDLLGVWVGSLLFLGICVVYAIAIYGFCPFRYVLSRMMKK